MNLYKILFRHYSPKDSQEGILTYLLAESDEQVYNWFCSKPTLKSDESIYISWMLKGDEYKKDFKERIIKCHGDMFDDESEVSDLYYGAIQYGWGLVYKNIKENDIIKLENLNIDIEDATK